MKRILVLLLIAHIAISVQAQYYLTGEDPASIKWKQINTDHFQIIYPEEFETQAQRVASIFSKVYDYSEKNFDYSPQPISVLLHTHTVKSNAYVAWAPKRVEFYTTPHQRMYAQDWLEQLCIHEFAHVIQMDKVNESIPGLIRLLFGEQIAAAAVGAYLPFWLLEGDAVTMETAFSTTGRGRLPHFMMETKAQVLELGEFDLSKAYLGSYKDFVPDHYKLGYWFVGKVKEEYGADIWSKAFFRAGMKPLSLNPLNKVLKKETGLKQNKLYQKVFNELKTEWLEEQLTIKPETYTKVSGENKTFASYRFGSEYNGIYYALKTSYDEIPAIVKIDSKGNEERLHNPGSIFEESFSAHNQLFIWSEQRPDIRWSHSDKSVICLFNAENGEKTEFKYENKLFAPVVSPKLNEFAAVELDKENNCYISIFNLSHGIQKSKFQLKNNEFIMTPCWDDKGETLYFIVLNEKGKYLAEWNPATKQLKTITDASPINIKNPYVSDGNLFFTGAYSGVDNIYAIDLNTKQKYQLTNVAFGADYGQLSDDGKSLIFSDYHAKGFDLVSAENKKENWKALTDFPTHEYTLAENLTKQTEGTLDFTEDNKKDYSSSSYSKFGHALNIHSWSPFYVDPDAYDANIGFSLFSQNVLGTSVTKFGYEYNSTEETGKLKLGWDYTGWFPVLSLDASYGKEASRYYQITQTLNDQNEVVRQDTTIKRFTWNEFDVSAGISLPINLTSGAYYRLFRPRMLYEYTQIIHDDTTPDQFFTGNYQTLAMGLYYHSLKRTSYQDLQSDLGLVLDFDYRFTPTGAIDFGNQMSIQSYLYLPGLMKNHGIGFYNAYQTKDLTGESSFSNRIKTPRGFNELQNTSFYSFSGDYKLPLLYPDLTLGKPLFVKRINASLFFDYAQLQVPVFSQETGTLQYTIDHSMTSMGVELWADMHVFRFIAPMEFGVRSTYRQSVNDFSFELLFSIDFSAI